MLLSNTLASNTRHAAVERHVAETRHLNGNGVPICCYLTIPYLEKEAFTTEKQAFEFQYLNGLELPLCCYQ